MSHLRYSADWKLRRRNSNARRLPDVRPLKIFVIIFGGAARPALLEGALGESGKIDPAQFRHNLGGDFQRAPERPLAVDAKARRSPRFQAGAPAPSRRLPGEVSFRSAWRSSTRRICAAGSRRYSGRPWSVSARGGPALFRRAGRRARSPSRPRRRFSSVDRKLDRQYGAGEMIGAIQAQVAIRNRHYGPPHVIETQIA